MADHPAIAPIVARGPAYEALTLAEGAVVEAALAVAYARGGHGTSYAMSRALDALVAAERKYREAAYR